MRKVTALCADDVIRTARTNLNYSADIEVSNAWMKVGALSVAGYLIKVPMFTHKHGAYEIVLDHYFEPKGKNSFAVPSWDQVIKYAHNINYPEDFS